jgi:hypothetical protein
VGQREGVDSAPPADTDLNKPNPTTESEETSRSILCWQLVHELLCEQEERLREDFEFELQLLFDARHREVYRRLLIIEEELRPRRKVLVA